MLWTNGAAIIRCAFDFHRCVFQRRLGKAHSHITLRTHWRFSCLFARFGACFCILLRALVHRAARAAVIGFTVDFHSRRMHFVLLRRQRHLAMWALRNRAFRRRFRGGFRRLLWRGQSRTCQHAQYGG